MLSRKKKTGSLVVPAKIRAHWACKIPEGLEDGHDSVAYKAVALLGSKRKNYTTAGEACYSMLRPNYNQYEITCSPRGKIRLDEKRFFDFFNIMVEAGILSELVEASFKDGKNYLYSPGAGLTNHQIYVALCWYRWTDSHPGMVYRFLELYHDQRYPWSVFQILVYVIAHHIRNSNHSFIETSVYGSRAGWQNPLLGVAAKVYFDPEDERHGDADYVNASITSICASLSTTSRVSVKSSNFEDQRWKKETAVSAFHVGNMEDLLNPKLIELYDIKQPTKAGLHEAMKGILKGDS